MQAYLKKKGCSISEQGQEIQDRLMRRAKDSQNWALWKPSETLKPYTIS
jgi:hypothetical protein